jgi:hypothetical protein
MVSRRDLLDKHRQELRVCVDGGPQPLESGHPWLRIAVVRMAYDSCKDGHGAAVYVHQGLGDDELDDLGGGLLDSDTD